MIINSNDGNLKVELLAQNVVELISSGVNSDKILILALNSFKKEKILTAINQKLFKKSNGFSQINVSTFAGVAYNSILKNWVSIENLIEKNGGTASIIPTLSGLDASQYFFKKIIREEDFSDYFSKKNLMHQLLRRYKLIVENCLSDKEVNEKSQILSESFSSSASKAINHYKIASSKNRIFDSLKQISSFNYLLQKNLIKDFENIEYFFADDVDEYSYVAFEFCKYMIKKSKNSLIFLDKDGCTREGYLCAYPNVYEKLKKDFKMPEQNIDSLIKLKKDAQNLYENIVNDESTKLLNFEAYSYSKRLEMIEAAASKVIELHKNGVPLSKIKIISPIIDENLFYSFTEFFKKHKINLQLLVGNKKITENLYVYATLTVLQLLNPSWGICPNNFDIRVLLNEILQVPICECEEFIKHYRKIKKLPDKIGCSQEGYNRLLALLNDKKLQSAKISEQFEKIFISLIAPNMTNNNDFDPLNMLAKSIREFEKIQENFQKFENISLQPKDWLFHIKSSVVSETPSKPTHIDDNAIIISTAQKIIDFSLDSDYQIWLDTTSSEWIKEDIGTIYNSWVFQKNFSEENFNNELNKKYTLEKTARSLRKLTQYAKEKIITYSSTFDVSGRENYGELAKFISVENKEIQNFNFTPRDDQKEILNYTNGRLAVPAVPGAGKTTVMLALLTELVKKDIAPQQILVLTYMESAARNFLNRFKKITNQQSNLPQISTIHAFAFKILMENNNYALVNLPEDFSICDDSLKTAIVKEICANNLPIGENLDDWSNLMLAAISKVKLKQIDIHHLRNAALKDSLLEEFMQVFSLYSRRLRELSLIDYDDLLLNAIELLKNNSDIASYYQEKFRYIIEDEAQDSSVVQQEFINILSKKYNNVIRCGDVNQAILGTFSNSDVKGFKDYIASNKKIEMFRSQRCCKQIYEFANSLITVAKNSQVMADAFYDLKMQGVDGKNPISINPIKYDSFELPIEEKEFVLNSIREKLANAKEEKPSFAILLRTNKQVSTWATFIEKQGLKVLCRGDGYKQKKVFNFLLATLEMYTAPWENKLVAKFYQTYCEIEKAVFDEHIFGYIQKLETKFLHPNFLKDNNIKNPKLEKFWWECFSIIEARTFDIQEIIIRCANNYFEDITDKSNVYLFSLLVKRYSNTLNNDDKFSLNNVEEIIKYFKKLLSAPTLKGINFFSKEDEAENLSGFVQIMTIHKAKGAEFDYVYLPEFTDFNYMTNFASCCNKITKRQKPLLAKLDKISCGKDISVSQIAKEEINETLRLIYVAITRAKLGLNISYSLKNDFKRENNPVGIIEELIVQ